MNVVVIAVTVWLVPAWIGLVFLIVKTGRNRQAHPPRPSCSNCSRPLLPFAHGCEAVSNPPVSPARTIL